MFSNYNKLEPNKIVYGNISNINGNLIDKAISIILQAQSHIQGKMFVK